MRRDGKIITRIVTKKRGFKSPRSPAYEILSQDTAIRTYLSDLSTPQKPASHNTRKITLRAAYDLLERLDLPVTTSVIADLVQKKQDEPRNMSLEKQLKLWKGEEPTRFTEEKIARILGIFRRNFARLNMTIHVSNTLNKTKPISEPILRAIWNGLTPDRRDILDLMVYGAERREALYLLPLGNIHLAEDTNVAILDVPARLSKTGIEHPSIIPKELAERLLDRAMTLGHSVLVPSYASIWREITKHAKESHGVRLTSHYLRKRFETTAERIPANEMNPNHWLMLMGCKPTFGHMPDIYSLLSNTELIQEYEAHLMPRLALTGETKTQHSQLEQLLEENKELKEQILKLTKLLTEKLQTL